MTDMPNEIWARRISDKPTGIEIVFGEVDNPMQKYIRADLAESETALRIVERLQNGEFSQDMMKACEKHLAESDGDMSAQGMFTAMATQLIKEETHDPIS